MEIKIDDLGAGKRVNLIGKLDTMTAIKLQQIIPQIVTVGCNIIINMQEITYVSSAGLRVLLMLHKACTGAKGKLKIVNLSKMVKEVFDATGFSSLFVLA